MASSGSENQGAGKKALVARLGWTNKPESKLFDAAIESVVDRAESLLDEEKGKEEKQGPRVVTDNAIDELVFGNPQLNFSGIDDSREKIREIIRVLVIKKRHKHKKKEKSVVPTTPKRPVAPSVGEPAEPSDDLINTPRPSQQPPLPPATLPAIQQQTRVVTPDIPHTGDRMLRHTIVTAVRDKSKDVTSTDTSELVDPLTLSRFGDFVASDFQFSRLIEWLSSDGYIKYSSDRDILLKLISEGSTPLVVRNQQNFVSAIHQHCNTGSSYVRFVVMGGEGQSKCPMNVFSIMLTTRCRLAEGSTIHRAHRCDCVHV